MAIDTHSHAIPRSLFNNWTGVEWLGLLVRICLVSYLAAVIAIHLFTVPKVIHIQATSCEPGRCELGQLNQSTLDWLTARGIGPEIYAGTLGLLSILVLVVGNLLLAVSVWQRPTAWLPMLYMIPISTSTLMATGGLYLVLQELPHFETTSRLVAIPMTIAWPLMIASFPNGRMVPRWSRILLAISALDLLILFHPSVTDSLPALVRATDEWAWIAAALICIPWRLHTTTNTLERRQTKIWGIGLVPLAINQLINTFWGRELNLLLLDGGIPSLIGQILWTVSILWLLTCFLLAIYQYRLYDLTVVIKRSLVYGALSIALVGLYVLIAGMLSVALHQPDSMLANLIATAVVVACFAPLRDALQRAIHRMLYGDQRDPYGVLTRFGDELERESSPDRLLQSVVDLAQESMQLSGVLLRVHNGEQSIRSGAITGASVEIPVRYQGMEVGTFIVAKREDGEAFTPPEAILLHEIGRQLGIAVASVEQANALRRSRERIVIAREEERRRIRRDLHDGLGPSLAALSLQVEIARDLIEIDSRTSKELLDAVLAQTRESILDIRRLVYGLRPPALDDLGLIGAIEAQRLSWEHTGLAVVLNAHPLPSLSAATEVAIYRIVHESMANVIRHAHAHTATITLEMRGTSVHLTVIDDGRGLPDNVHQGVGLHSMSERAAELGAHCTVSNLPEGGTIVRAIFMASEGATNE